MNQESKPFILDGLYETRAIIMVESAPQSNVYHQLILTQEQFKKFSDCIFSMMPKYDLPHDHSDGKDHIKMIMEQDHEAKLKDTIRSFYTPKEVDKMIQAG